MRPEARPRPGPRTPSAFPALPALPAATARLFPHHDLAGLDPPGAAPFLIGRLLEDGDGADLRWLAAGVAEADLAAWLARRGGRQLSRRSLAFWRVVLGPPAAGGRSGEPAPVGGAGPAAEPAAAGGAGRSTATARASAAVREAADLWPL